MPPPPIRGIFGVDIPRNGFDESGVLKGGKGVS